MHPISSSLVKHTQCAALIPFYNQHTRQCYGDVTFLMHHLRWLAWNVSSEGSVVSCRETAIIQNTRAGHIPGYKAENVKCQQWLYLFSWFFSLNPHSHFLYFCSCSHSSLSPTQPPHTPPPQLLPPPSLYPRRSSASFTLCTPLISAHLVLVPSVLEPIGTTLNRGCCQMETVCLVSRGEREMVSVFVINTFEMLFWSSQFWNSVTRPDGTVQRTGFGLRAASW